MSETAEQPTTEAPEPKWGDPISAERQAELQVHLDRWRVEAEHGERKGPFDIRLGEDYVLLSGADVFWLAERVRGTLGLVPDLHLEGANLFQAHLEHASLYSAHLEGAYLNSAHLEGAKIGNAHLEHANLAKAHLKGVDLSNAYLTLAHFESAHLEGADLRNADLKGATLAAYLEGTILFQAHLEGAYLYEARLEGANLIQAHLEGANLIQAHLEGADLSRAHLEGADLTGASFDKTTRLNDAVLTDASLDQLTFDQANLTVVDWSLVTTLGDEYVARERKVEHGEPKTGDGRLKAYKAAVRANRVLSVQLQAQGLAEDADRFAYQAKVLQRQVLRYQRKTGAYLFSWVLAGLAGYGYRLRRIFIVYGLAVLLFAVGYFLAGGITPQAHLSLQQQALDALQVSLNAIHGRVFFTQLGLDTLQSWLATLESIVGIVIEGVFVAMLIQRFFAR